MTTTKKNLIRIATRKSPLALWQAYFVRDQLLAIHNDIEVELLTMSTRGDKLLDTPLAKIGGKGLFLKELEHSLLTNEADIAVHSMKDVPVEFPDGLKLSVICERENPTDAFVSNHYEQLKDLPQGAVIGTCSLRRQAQIKSLRPDIKIKDLRGNVNTRLKKLDDGEFDAIILASAGLIRLEMQDRIKQYIDINISLPALGQGAVGIECRAGDEKIEQYLTPLAHQDTEICLTAERALNKRLEGGCQVPIGGFAHLDGQTIHLQALVASIDGKKVIRSKMQANINDAEDLGVNVAEELLSQGADIILNEVYANNN